MPPSGLNYAHRSWNPSGAKQVNKAASSGDHDHSMIVLVPGSVACLCLHLTGEDQPSGLVDELGSCGLDWIGLNKSHRGSFYEADGESRRNKEKMDQNKIAVWWRQNMAVKKLKLL